MKLFAMYIEEKIKQVFGLDVCVCVCACVRACVYGMCILLFAFCILLLFTAMTVLIGV